MHRRESAISHDQREASDRDSWRSSVKKASRKFEAERHEAAKERRRRQEERAASRSSPTQTFACSRCSKVCTSRTGLFGHKRGRKNWTSTFPKSSSARNQPSVIITIVCLHYTDRHFLPRSTLPAPSCETEPPLK